MKSTKVFRGLQLYAAFILSFILFFLLISPAEASQVVEPTCSKQEEHCEGTKKYLTGATYNGEFRYGKEHGHGIFSWKDGSQYTGGFEEGLRHGYGVMNFSDGSKFEGNWERGLIHGNGTYNFSCGHTYTGQWVNNEMSGQGRIVYSTGDIYEGGMLHNRSEGKGKVIRRDQSTFAGVHREGSRQGEGIIIWDNGLQLSGNWDYDFLNREATFTFKSGLTVLTNWASGKVKKEIEVRLPNENIKKGHLDELVSMLEGTSKKGFKLATSAIYYGIAQEFVTQDKAKKALEWMEKAMLVLDNESEEFKAQINAEVDFIRAIEKSNICW